MKTPIKSILSLFITMFILIAAGCTKHDRGLMNDKDAVNNDHQTSISSKSGPLYPANINPNNPYDTSLYNYISNALEVINQSQDTNSTSSFEEYWKEWEDLLSGNPLNLINIDTTIIDSNVNYRMETYNDLITDSTYSLEQFLSKSIIFEDEIINSTELSDEQEQLLLYYVSNLKQTRYVFQTVGIVFNFNGILTDASSWEKRLNDCIKKKLDDIFYYGNPITQAVFIAFLPESFLIIVAECLWDATFPPE